MLAIDNLPKIDAHIHYNSGRSQIFELAADFNFDLLSINTEVPEFPSIDQQQQLVLNNRNEFKNGNLYYATTVSTENIFVDSWTEKAINKIKQDVAKGASGVKFWKNIGMSIKKPGGNFLMLDDPIFTPVFNFLEEKQIPVLGHQGEPKNCWLPIDEMTVTSDREYFANNPQYHMYKHEEYPDYWKHIEARDNILEQHPNLQFVGLHLASLEWSLEEISRRLDKYPNLAVDLAERISHLYYHTAKDRKKVISFIKKYQDRIIYGTDIIDGPDLDSNKITNDLKDRWQSHWEFFATDKTLTSSQIADSFKGLNLPKNVLEKIYRTNAVRWYQLTK
ncbi:amidohydrolase family protein [Fodinibius sp. Rm-B-1B1-1]|uniref:amidohydrolase family protein n=1 Tax=Fodinibius alkaliphilus TaxID=3140241 RepID=UPI00315AD73B